MRSTRLRRIDDQMKRVVGEALLTHVQDPRIGFVTVTGVKVSKEFDTAKVFVSVLGDEKTREESMLGLRSAAPYLQSRIGKAMRLRRIPLLRFIYDDSVERAIHLDSLLREHNTSIAEETADADGSLAQPPDVLDTPDPDSDEESK